MKNMCQDGHWLKRLIQYAVILTTMTQMRNKRRKNCQKKKSQCTTTMKPSDQINYFPFNLRTRLSSLSESNTTKKNVEKRNRTKFMYCIIQ